MTSRTSSIGLRVMPVLGVLAIFCLVLALATLNVWMVCLTDLIAVTSLCFLMWDMATSKPISERKGCQSSDRVTLIALNETEDS